MTATLTAPALLQAHLATGPIPAPGSLFSPSSTHQGPTGGLFLGRPGPAGDTTSSSGPQGRGEGNAPAVTQVQVQVQGHYAPGVLAHLQQLEATLETMTLEIEALTGHSSPLSKAANELLRHFPAPAPATSTSQGPGTVDQRPAALATLPRLGSQGATGSSASYSQKLPARPLAA